MYMKGSEEYSISINTFWGGFYIKGKAVYKQNV